LIHIRDEFNCGPKAQARYRFMFTMGSLRDLIRKLENLRFGCPTGSHASRCTCRVNLRGVSCDSHPTRKKQ
jgi:hypothetical protein